MNLADPRLAWLTLAAPLAALVAIWLLARRRRAEEAWTGRLLRERLRRGVPRRPAWVAVPLAIAVLGLSLALARPRWGESTELHERRGLDLVFVVDTSLSMNAADVTPSRFWLAQAIVRRIVAAAPGHRVALVAAEGEGEVLSPLTVDGAVLDLVLDALAPGSLSLPGTRLARSLERALELFPPGGDTHRAILLLSDGEDHGGEIDALERRLDESGVTLLAVAIGSERGAPIPIPGGRGEFKRDRRGEVVVSRRHDEVLRRLANATGGSFHEATTATFDPAAIVADLDALGGKRIEAETISTLEERFQWPLGAATAALLLGLALGPWSRRSAEGTR